MPISLMTSIVSEQLRQKIKKLEAENAKLQAVADAARILRVDGKGLSIAQANQALDDALARLDSNLIDKDSK
jgi:NAD/NADP transhydrogenase beta subunit